MTRFRRGVSKGEDLFQARLPATITLDEAETSSEDDLVEDEGDREENDDGDDDEN